jgi:hypothetical protein
MKGHIDIKELASYIAGMTGENKGARLREHIAVCETCSKRYNSLISMFDRPDTGKIAPAESVKLRLINSYRGMKIETGGSTKTATSILFKWKYSIAFSAAAIIIFALYFTLFVPESFKQVSADITFLKSDVFINDAKAAMSDKILALSRIKLDKDSAIRFIYGPLDIKSAGEGNITVDRAIRIDNKVDLIFNIMKGRLLFSCDEGRTDISYKLTTRDADIIPHGTEFFVDAGMDNTVIVLKSGRLTIASRSSGYTSIAEPGKKYTLTTSILSGDITHDDLKNIDKFNSIFAKSDAGSNVKPVKSAPESVKKTEFAAKESKEATKQNEAPAEKPSDMNTKNKDSIKPSDSREIKKDINDSKKDMREMKKRERRSRR